MYYVTVNMTTHIAKGDFVKTVQLSCEGIPTAVVCKCYKSKIYYDSCEDIQVCLSKLSSWYIFHRCRTKCPNKCKVSKRFMNDNHYNYYIEYQCKHRGPNRKGKIKSWSRPIKLQHTIFECPLFETITEQEYKQEIQQYQSLYLRSISLPQLMSFILKKYDRFETDIFRLVAHFIV